MAVLDAPTAPLTPQEQQDRVQVPDAVTQRIKRGRDRMRDKSAEVEECLRFWRGDQYVYRVGKAIQSQSTTSNYDGTGKPRHRVRTVRNIILDHVRAIVSGGISRVPSYEVDPTTSDDRDVSAAALASKVLLSGYVKWDVRKAMKRLITLALVADEGFAWPYWDSSVGPYLGDTDPLTGQTQLIGEGEIKIRLFSRNEVYWEPGIRFEDSPWIGIEQARTLESVKETEGFYGETLKPNAQALDGQESNPHSKLVLVTEYLERPCATYPDGRWLTIVDGRQICPEKTYPVTQPRLDEEGNFVRDADGTVVCDAVDEPALHKLSYITDPAADRDMGLVRHLLDSQRTINDCTNKQLEMKNMMLVPKLAIQNGRLKKGQRVTDEPGQVLHIEGNGNFQWMPFPGIPPELTTLKEEAKGDMARIAAQNAIPNQVDSGKGIAALLEKDQSANADFWGEVASVYTSLGRHCLYLVQKHYTEPRLLMIRGEEGVEPVRDFLGAQLRGQVDVTVLPGSVEPRTREWLEARLNTLAQMFPGRFSPEEILTALESGSAESLIHSYELDVRRARNVIQKIKDGVFYNVPNRPVFPGEDPGPALDDYGQPIVQRDATGAVVTDQMGQPQYVQATSVPGWMPRPIDDLAVNKKIFADFMKTEEFDRSDPEQQSAAMTYYAALLQIEQREAAKQAEQQQMMAASQGMGNAAKPQGIPPLPAQQLQLSPAPA